MSPARRAVGPLSAVGDPHDVLASQLARVVGRGRCWRRTSVSETATLHVGLVGRRARVADAGRRTARRPIDWAGCAVGVGRADGQVSDACCGGLHDGNAERRAVGRGSAPCTPCSAGDQRRPQRRRPLRPRVGRGRKSGARACSPAAANFGAGAWTRPPSAPGRLEHRQPQLEVLDRHVLPGRSTCGRSCCPPPCSSPSAAARASPRARRRTGSRSGAAGTPGAGVDVIAGPPQAARDQGLGVRARVDVEQPRRDLRVRSPAT